MADEPMEPVEAGASATIARDVNKFDLGMPIAQAAERVEVTFTQGELVQSRLGNVEYDFGVCPSGRIYRIGRNKFWAISYPTRSLSGHCSKGFLRNMGALTPAHTATGLGS
ncbi:MAG: hypothetical protein R3D89_03990 [Sphingomonadaceae bacterium]